MNVDILPETVMVLRGIHIVLQHEEEEEEAGAMIGSIFS